MVVRIQIPSDRGHNTLLLSVPEAKEKIASFDPRLWLVAVNGKLVNNTSSSMAVKNDTDASFSVKDGDTVKVAPVVQGG